jgi:hypothetical protein
MPKHLTNFTPFFMVYGSDVVLPTELQYRYSRVQAYLPVEVEQAPQDAINLLEESSVTPNFKVKPNPHIMCA